MESLPEDLLPELLRALGNSTHSYAAGVRVSGVNAALRDLGRGYRSSIRRPVR